MEVLNEYDFLKAVVYGAVCLWENVCKLDITQDGGYKNRERSLMQGWMWRCTSVVFSSTRVKREHSTSKKRLITRSKLGRKKENVQKHYHTCFLHCLWSNPCWSHLLPKESIHHCHVSYHRTHWLFQQSLVFVGRLCIYHQFYCGSVQKTPDRNE